VGSQPPLDDLGVVDDHVVADHGDRGRSRVAGGELVRKAMKVALTALPATW
jgi:hypothetical protein